MDVPLSQDQLGAVVHKSSFSTMKEIDHKFAPPALMGGQPTMMRSGEAGSARHFLSEAQRRQVDKVMVQELARLGSDFPYKRFYVREVEPERALNT